MNENNREYGYVMKARQSWQNCAVAIHSAFSSGNARE